MNLEEILKDAPKEMQNELKNKLAKIDELSKKIINDYLEPATTTDDILIVIGAFHKAAFTTLQVFEEVFAQNKLDVDKIKEFSNAVH
jgi:hypothetical protein